MHKSGAYLLAILLVHLLPLCLAAKVGPAPPRQMQQRYEQALAYHQACQPDSALLLLEQLETQLAESRWSSTPFALRVSLLRASILEMELQAQREAIIALEETYRDSHKARSIAALQYEANRRQVLLTLLVGVCLLLALTIYYAIGLEKARQKGQLQANTLAHANEELTHSLQQQLLLQGEVHHRVKNHLQVLISMLELQREDVTDPKALQSLDALASRIHSIAALHELLYQHQGSNAINLLEYTQTLCQHVSKLADQAEKPCFQLEMDAREFSLATLMPLGIMLNELLTNSLKYAAGLGRQLQIGIRLVHLPDGYCIHYHDNGPGFPAGELTEREGGLGTYLLRSMSRQLNGYLETQNEGGAVYRIFFKEKA